MRKDKLKKIIRLHEKIKEIRQQFLQAVTYGRLSGSGKVVFEFYDEPVHWGDSPWQNHCVMWYKLGNSTQNESDRSDGDDDDGEKEGTSTQSATESKKISRKRNF